MNDKCVRCGESVTQMVVYAMIQQYGAKVSGSPDRLCPDGKKHELVAEEKPKATEAK